MSVSGYNSHPTTTPSNSFPGATAPVTKTTTPTPGQQPPQPGRPATSFRINTNNNDLAIKNAIAGGLLSSPTGMPPATYISKFMTSSAPKINSNPFVNTNPFINPSSSGNSAGGGSNINKTHLVRRSSKRKSIGGVSSRVGVGPGINPTSALTAQIAAAAAAATAKGTNANNANNRVKATGGDSGETNDSNTGSGTVSGKGRGSGFKTPDLRPYYPSFGSMGLIPSPATSQRSLSYGGPSTTVAAETGTMGDNQNIVQDPPEPGQHGYHPVYGLRRSNSVGKSSGAAGGSGASGSGGGKTGFATRFRKLRHRRGSRDSTKKGPFNNAGLPPRMAFSMSPSKPLPLFLDPTLPPPPPIRTNSSVSLNRDSPTATGSTTPTTANIAYSIPFGYGGMGVAPLSVVTKNSGVGLSSSSGAGGQSTGASTPTTGQTPRESSSTARFRKMIKRNVGLSTPTAATHNFAPGYGGATASTNSSPIVGATGSLLAPNGGSKVTSMSTGAIVDLVSGDDQPSKFRVSRMKRRKKKLTKKALNDGGSPLSDEDDIPLSMRVPNLKEQQLAPSSRHHRFMPHLHSHHHHRHRQLYSQLSGQRQGQGERTNQPIVFQVASQALREARESNQDPNVLLAELEPLPAKSVEAITGLSGDTPLNATLLPSAASTMQSTTSAATANLMMFPLIPMMASIIPSSSMGSGTGSINSSMFISTQQEKQQQQTSPRGNMTSLSMTFASQAQYSPRRPLQVAGAHPLSERNFLFKSYQNSKFQGHYAFRIRGDQLEFGKLPVAYEQACAQYFREVDVSFRLLEKKAKDWRDQRKEALAKREKMQERYRRRPVRSEPGPPAYRSRQTSLDQLKQEQPKEKILRDTPSSLAEYDSTIGSSGVPSRSNSRAGTRSRSSSVSRIETGSCSSLQLSFGMTKDDPNQPQLVHADSIRRILLDRHPLFSSENVLTQSPTNSVNNSQEDLGQFPDTATATANNSKQDHRSNSASGGGRARGYSEPAHPDELLLLLDDEVDNINNPPIVSGAYYNELDDLLIQDVEHYRNLPAWRQRELREQQERQWAVDDDYWQKVECEHSTEVRAAQYGLELCLLELIKPVDYEPFDSIHQIEILNENRDAALFSIANASRTNVMWLESPSLKLKYEFFNWIAISLMDHGEPDLQEEARQDNNELDINSKEEQRCRGKTLSTTLIRAIESDEVQSALHPSPVTGLTLAETVDGKIKDVNERIVVCARIMGAARFNLNRLKYEIELEQRSIRLFRQYKIAIAIVTVLILLFFWYLYNCRHTAASAAATAAQEAAKATKAGHGFTHWSPFSLFASRDEPQHPDLPHSHPPPPRPMS
ncbi:hypothetical protein KI688_011049 [Linnemannia hyalina]|uniref:Uncharacterized protein n=1 Tax=Linnemannia hyalina TaxID=64524 RepID=A0A9P7XWI0_9FUNG|nr:hypothetical protein KI688_011049 [Linnemannia hyalina]